jgi:hypothetical protein
LLVHHKPARRVGGGDRLERGGDRLEHCDDKAKSPAYVVAEIDVTNAEPYDKEYVPPAAKAITDAGGRYVVRGGKT